MTVMAGRLVVILVLVVLFAMAVVVIGVQFDFPLLALRLENDVLDIRRNLQLNEDRDVIFPGGQQVALVVFDDRPALEGIHLRVGQMGDDPGEIRQFAEHVVAEGRAGRILMLGVMQQLLQHILADLIAHTDNADHQLGQVAARDGGFQLLDILANFVEVMPLAIRDHAEQGFIDALAVADPEFEVRDELAQRGEEIGGAAEVAVRTVEPVG